MALKIEEFDVNYITAVGGKSVNGLKFANFRYENSGKFPRNIVYGGMRVEQGKFGNYLESTSKTKKPRSSLSLWRKLCLESVAVV